MSTEFKQIIGNISHLSSDEKAMVAHCLISSLEVKHDDNVDQAQAELAENRFNEMKSGKVQSVSWDGIKNRIKQKYLPVIHRLQRS